MEAVPRRVIGLSPINLVRGIARIEPLNRLVRLCPLGVAALPPPLPSCIGLADRAGVDIICADERA